ncbi:MAG: hypothetical protein JWN04_5600 [Myxococcaceae bacterium]|nr:hypothetical protein [Myxococcaceae bacterium]
MSSEGGARLVVQCSALVVPRCKLALVLCGAVCLWLSAPVAVVRADALNALVRLSDAADQSLFRRIRGQTSDLTVTLQRELSVPLEASLRAQLATARALAQTHGARVVLWAMRSPHQLTLVVADLALDRVLVRQLPAGDGERDRSAQEEAAALVVRGALRASLAGEPLGRAEQELAPSPRIQLEPSPAAAPELVPRTRLTPGSPRLTEPREPARGPSLSGSFAAGMLAGYDGATKRGNYGLALHTALQRARLELGLRGSLGLAAAVQSSFADVQLSQHRAAVYAGWLPVQRRELQLTLAASAGACVFSTRVRSDAPLFRGQSEHGVLATLGAGALLVYLPRALHGRAGLAWSAFGEVFPERLSLGSQSGASFVRLAHAWPVQPVLTMELLVRVGR